MRTWSGDNRKLAIESAAFGLGYTAVLIWFGSALVGSFTGNEAFPYWPALPQLRTDTAGVISFAVAIVTLSVSKFLQLRRRGSAPAQPVDRLAARPAGVHGVQAIAETAAFLSTAMVIYLSFNEITHPYTLRLQLTHLWPWPSEGTVRVIGLGICLVAVATRRYLQATGSTPAQPATTPAPATPHETALETAAETP
ncbi:hypothetical protein EAS64_15790 [Trebonia kvetii]|uniref:Uncharacterized protein n=1 Tax=Trebonia kvetii TaxID=2480626 RepID=A0A6P2BYA8_9ACTN|nr:hypothetical protein [Trebonia kvetii]TVZ03900.1 hypothetical protein EAS64_15790 [Trebonia kvetii]